MVLDPRIESEGRRCASYMVMHDAFATVLLFIWGIFMVLSSRSLDRENSGKFLYTEGRAITPLGSPRNIVGFMQLGIGLS